MGCGASSKKYSRHSYTDLEDFEQKDSGHFNPSLSPADLQKHLSELLDDWSALEKEVQACWTKAVGSKLALDIHGLQDFIHQVQKDIQVPADMFGDLKNCFVDFDFNGNGELCLVEAVRCVKAAVKAYHVQLGGAPEMHVPHKTPAEAGYEILKEIGTGAQGVVNVVKDSSGEKAMKICKKTNLDAEGMEEMWQEMQHMKDLEEKWHIAKCHDIFQDDTNFYMVSDLCRGGDFLNVKNSALSAGIYINDEWYRILFSQCFQGLAYMHQHAIMHCDIKEHNLLLKSDSYGTPDVVIIDLGLAQAAFSPKNRLTGTPGYIPPETWDEKQWYPRGDVFSMGVVCFQMMADISHLFDGEEMLEVECATKMNEPPWDKLKTEGWLKSLGTPKANGSKVKDWLSNCLEKERLSRATALQTLQHEWFQQKGPTVFQAWGA